jgi:membrane-associated HD superfamily phosphohydrolase
LKKGVINDKDLLDQEIEKGMVLRNIQTREEKRILSPLTFLDIKEAKAKLRSQAISPSPLLGREWNPLILKIGESLLRPNVTFNKSETEDRKKKAREKLNPVYFQVKRGEAILRAGERVQEEHLPILQALKKAQERSHLISVLIGLGLLTFLLLASLYKFSTKNIRKIALSQRTSSSSPPPWSESFLKLYQLITGILERIFVHPASSYSISFPLRAAP